jgi:hypothetical protein
VAGAIIGVLAVAAFGGILYYFFKNPEQFKSLLVSFLRMHLWVPLVCTCDMFLAAVNEVAVMVSICLEIWSGPLVAFGPLWSFLVRLVPLA